MKLDNYIRAIKRDIEYLEKSFISEDDYIKAQEIYRKEEADRECDDLRVQSMAMETYLIILKNRLKRAEGVREHDR